MRTRFNLNVLLCAALLFCAACSAPNSKPEFRQIMAMDTSVNLTLYSDNAAPIFDAITTRLQDLESHMRVQWDTSELAAVNAAAGKNPVKVSADVLKTALVAKHIFELSDGAFDPTIGPITLLWNFESDEPHIPTESERKTLLPLVNGNDFMVDEKASTLFLKRPGMKLDFGGCAKGIGAIEAAHIARAAGVKSGMLNLGDSSIYFIGTKPEGKKWRVGVQNPIPATPDGVVRGDLLGVIEVADQAVQTSGTYQHFFKRDGVRYHHLMSTKTGMPVENGLEQVTVIVPANLGIADGLSTAAFVLGPEKGRAMIDSIPDAAAIFVSADRTVRLSSRAKSMFTLSDATFKVIAN